MVDSCTENDVNLNGVIYRDLWSLLLRLHIRLAHHHADLTNNYIKKSANTHSSIPRATNSYVEGSGKNSLTRWLVRHLAQISLLNGQHFTDYGPLRIPILINQGENDAEAFKDERGKTKNNGLLDVASNSCLVSFVCSVAFTQFQGSPLPAQRICPYEAIVNFMLTLWSSKRSILPGPDSIPILSDIANYVHANSALGLIHEQKMKEICIQSIKDSPDKALFIQGDPEMIKDQACEFMQIIREDVGILAARGESLDGFLHLTFQEYFTCLKLIHHEQENFASSPSISEDNTKLAAHSLHHHANEPRFRVPTPSLSTSSDKRSSLLLP